MDIGNALIVTLGATASGVSLRESYNQMFRWRRGYQRRQRAVVRGSILAIIGVALFAFALLRAMGNL